MKFVYLFLAFFVLSSQAMASGKILVEPVQNLVDGSLDLKLGFSVYERFHGPYAFVSYTGMGREMDSGDMLYAVQKLGVARMFGNLLQLELGAQVSKDYEVLSAPLDKAVYLKMGYQVW